MSIHDTIEPLEPKDIRREKQVKLRPGECAVVFAPTVHGMVAQRIVAHPLGDPTASAQQIALLMTWACAQPDIRERLTDRLEEIKRERF